VNHSKFFILSVFGLLLCAPHLVSSESNIEHLLNAWFPDSEVIDDKYGMDIYARIDPDSELTFWWSAKVLPFSYDAIEQALDDVDRYVEWVPDAIEVNSLETIDETSWAFYNATDVRWPFKDRQFLIKMSKSAQEDGSHRWAFEPHADDSFEWHEKRIIMKAMQGYWSVFPLGDASCLVAYYLSIDIGGGIPDNLSKPYLRSVPAENLEALGKFLAEY
jgi:hypothetical protein